MTRLSLKPKLSPQELRVLQCLWDGLQRKEIGPVVGLSENTVKNYLHQIYAKLNAQTGIQVVRRGLEWGLLTVEPYREEDPS